MVWNAMASNIGLFFFAVSSALFLPGFSQSSKKNFYTVAGLVAFIAATVAVSYAAFGRYDTRIWLEAGGLLLTVFIAWLTLLASLLVRMINIGTFVAPLLTFIMFLQLFFSDPSSQHDMTNIDLTVLAGVHILLAVIGEAFAVFACALSIFSLFQRRALKQKSIALLKGQGFALERIDRYLIQSLWAGFIFLSSGLITGAIYLQQFVERRPEGVEIKIVWAIVVWVWYLATLFAKHIFGLPNKRIAHMGVIGFVLLSLSFFGFLFFRTLGGA